MSKVTAVVRREFIERVRTKGFWIATVLGPMLLAALIVLPGKLMQGGGSRRIVVVDGGAVELGARITALLDSSDAFDAVRVADGPRVADSLEAEVRAKRLEGFLLLPADLVETARAEYRGSSVSGFEANERLERVLRQTVLAVRLERAGVDPTVVERANPRVALETKKIARGKTTSQSAVQAFALAYVMAMVLYMSILIYGMGVMTSVLEEKTSKIVELLVSSMRPFQLLLGKLLGVASVSLVQFLIWIGFMKVILSQRGGLTSGGGASAIFQLPPVPLTTGLIVVFFFVGGFLLYASMFAAVGAMSNNLQEAQQAAQPISMLLVVALISMFSLLNSPSSTYAIVLSFIPFTAPIIMPVRWAAGSVASWEVALAMAMLVGGVLGIVWVAGRIYRIGILMTGKRPSLKDLARWVRTA